MSNHSQAQKPSQKIKFALCEGDGIGPEITSQVLRIIEAAGLSVDPVKLKMGEQSYRAGFSSGIDHEAWQALSETPTLLKAPITTPRGSGYKSLNVTLRKTLGLFANIRPVRSFGQIIDAPALDLIIVRENEEDTYAGIEHRQTAEVTQCLKLITQPGSERIIDYAFRMAESSGREKVTMMTKDNIMKITDGLFARIFNKINDEFTSIDGESMIIDIGAARLAAQPDQFQVILAQNLYGDILSDIAAEIAGSVGLCGSANIGENFAMFEAIHGSAPDIAGQGIANPSGLLNAACMMLGYVGHHDSALQIENAWLKTLEDGFLTRDIYGGKQGQTLCDSRSFADAVIDRIGQKPQRLAEASGITLPAARPANNQSQTKPEKSLMGVDLFLDYDESGRHPDQLARQLNQAICQGWSLTMITNRGVKVYPDGNPATFKTDHWRCRFFYEGQADQLSIANLMIELGKAGFDIIKTENLYSFDGEPGFSRGQGE